MYTVIFKSRARKELLSIPDKVLIAIEEKIDKLSLNPRPHGCEKLTGRSNEYRIRIGN